MRAVRARVATTADAAAVTDLFALAFYEDPTWSWAFSDPGTRMEGHRAMWGLEVNSAIPYGWVWLTDGCGAAALWIPPGEHDLNEEDQAAHEPLLREHVGPGADEVLELVDEFAANRPTEPHYYLSLLGTHPDRRGRGEGMALLEDNLERIDAQGAAAYLESTNPDNNHRYEARGFAQVGEFTTPNEASPVVACMWREPR